MQVTRTDIKHVCELAATMRPEDVAEVAASSGQSPLEALLEGFRGTVNCFTLIDDSEHIVAIGGFTEDPTQPRTASIWMLGSIFLETSKVTMYKVGRRILDAALSQYDVLTNDVDARNTMHIKWLKSLGAVLKPARPFGLNGEPFHEFTFHKEQPLCAPLS